MAPSSDVFVYVCLLHSPRLPTAPIVHLLKNFKYRCTSGTWVDKFVAVFKGLFWPKQRRDFCQPIKQPSRKKLKTSCQLQKHPNMSIKQLWTTHSHTHAHTHCQFNSHKSISKRNLTHKPSSCHAQSPSKALKHSGRSIGFQEASNT